MQTLLFFSFLVLAFRQSIANVTTGDALPTAYTAPGTFPTSVYDQYWNDPTATSAQPQPVITDPVTNIVFPESLTDPDNFPKNDTVDPYFLPSQSSPSELLSSAIAQIKTIASNPAFGGNKCAQCQASLEVAKFLAMAVPEQGPPLAQAMCQYFNYSTICYNEYSVLALGSIFTQIVALANVGGYDGQNLCSKFANLCPIPPTVPLNLTNWFAKPKPTPLPEPKKPSGERLKVLHVSDIHIDPRYATGAEANCSQGLCCRKNAYNTHSPNQILLPASRYGAYHCDTPMSLMLSAMEAIAPLTGTEETGFNFSIFTGDLTSHDSNSQYSRAYVENAEVIVYDLLKKFIGPAPVYATVGNHDTYVQFQMIPYTLGGYLGQQFNWLYEHISSMWYYEGWLPEESVEFARTHYAAYTVKRPDGLRIISLDTDMWYRTNYVGYINSSNPDAFGILRYLTDELQDAEDAGDRVWIIGHVLAGWDGTAAQSNPTNLFYQIVDRYSPHVIANIFWGHTHEDEFAIFYANNGTTMNADTALAVSWIGPSLTPLTNLNSGFRMYEVDSATFEILDAHTWMSAVNKFPTLDNQTEYGPTYVHEYSTREAYGGNIAWGATDPLNATWWHLVTEQMQSNSALVQAFNMYEGKSSVNTRPCNATCEAAKICYMRSGSAPLALQNCPTGYGSVQ